MSVIVIATMKVDPAAVSALFESHKATFEGVAAEAKKVGALHHQFVLGDGEVVILDEWDKAESFQTFFGSNPDIPKLMEAAGVQGPPDVSIYEATASPDKF